MNLAFFLHVAPNQIRLEIILPTTIGSPFVISIGILAMIGIICCLKRRGNFRPPEQGSKGNTLTFTLLSTKMIDWSLSLSHSQSN